MRRAVLAFAAFLACTPALAQTGQIAREVEPAKHVIVVVNDAVPESPEIGKHYCRMRQVPEANILHLDTVSAETTTWPDFREKILKPFTAFLDRFPEALYVVPTYGVPLRISNEKNDRNPESNPAGLGNAACVDAELALALRPDHEIEAWVNNAAWKADRRITREDTLLLVSRLDGPTPAIAKALVDKAIYAETYGARGKAYLDTRGLQEDGGSYGSTDCEMRDCLLVWDTYGIAHQDEDTKELMDVSTCTDCLFYWGWYTGQYNGTRPFKFNPGAIAAHLHSFSATTIRSDRAQWVGPLLAHGATCSMGTVFEPFTIGFPAMHVVHDRMLKGHTWGEATAMASRILSWMCVFVGDPLYAPWAKGLRNQQEENYAVATQAYERVAAALDAGDLERAQQALEAPGKLPVPFAGGKDLSFLRRELAARRLAPATGTVAGLLAALVEATGAPDAKAKQAAVEKALAISPMNFEANLEMGKLLVEGGKFAPAIASLENARKVAAEAPESEEPLGRALAGQMKWKEAIPHLKKAADAGAGAECLSLLGECLLKSGDAAKAVEFLSEAARRDPLNRAVAMALAKACEACRDYAGALRALQGAVAIAPEDTEEIAAYKAAWKALATAAERAKDKAERDRAAYALADFGSPLFEVPSKGVALKIAKSVEDLWTESNPKPLKAPPSEALAGGTLPRLAVGNTGTDMLTIRLKGPSPREFALAPSGGKSAPKDVGLYPGEYDVVVEALRGRERTLATGHFSFDTGKRYGLILDAELAPTLPPKPK